MPQSTAKTYNPDRDPPCQSPAFKRAVIVAYAVLIPLVVMAKKDADKYENALQQAKAELVANPSKNAKTYTVQETQVGGGTHVICVRPQAAQQADSDTCFRSSAPFASKDYALRSHP